MKGGVSQRVLALLYFLVCAYPHYHTLRMIKCLVYYPHMTRTFHGMAKTRFYKTFDSLKARCENKNNNRYSLYGGRGIKCTWKNFVEFRDDMHDSYLKHIEEFGEKNTQIDRIDVDKNYSKDNCRWATAREQVLNRRSGIRLITYKGKTQHLCEWAEELGMNKGTIWSRLNKGWPIKKVLSTKYYGHS